MSDDERLQKNIRRTTALHALKQVHTLVDAANAEDQDKEKLLRWTMRYGWLVLLLLAALLARFLGVF